MSRIIITDSTEFENIINTLELSSNRIKDVFARENKNMSNIDNTDVWRGKTQEKIYEKYKGLSENYEGISDSLDIFIKFLKTTLQNYTNLETKIQSNQVNNSSQLDVNS